MPFAKYAHLTCQTRDNIRTPFLLADDRILIFSGADIDMTSPLNSNMWQVVQVPNMYLTDNWPIKVGFKVEKDLDDTYIIRVLVFRSELGRTHCGCGRQTRIRIL